MKNYQVKLKTKKKLKKLETNQTIKEKIQIPFIYYYYYY